MHLKHINKFIISALFLGSIAGSNAQAATAWLQQIHPLEDAHVIETPDGNHDVIIKAFGLAKSSIQMWMYHLTDQDVINALIQAQGRGVNVQVILDSASARNSKYMSVAKQLQNAGVDAVLSSTAFSITHTKTFMVDGTLAYISTMNLVGHFQGMRDYGLFTQDADIMKELQSVFTADLQNAQNDTNETPDLSNPNLVWSPTNSEEKLTDLVNSAQHSITVTVENLGQTNILDALTQASYRGVSVEIITPMCDLNSNPVWNYQFLYTLARSGVQARVMPGPSSVTTPYMHAKTIVVDGKVAFLGSENFSQNSLRSARETGVVFANVAGIEVLNSVFQKDWGNAVPLQPTPPTCPKPFADDGTSN